LIGSLGWQNALLVLAAAVLDCSAGALGLRAFPAVNQHGACEQTIIQGAARGVQISQLSLMVGYFVCGFQVVVFSSLSTKIGAYSPSGPKALALIVLFTAPTWYLLWAAKLRSGRSATIYFSVSGQLDIPGCTVDSPTTVYIFAASVMGLQFTPFQSTNALHVRRFSGIQHLSMLGGFVFQPPGWLVQGFGFGGFQATVLVATTLCGLLPSD
jgi:hypothetical protein